MTVLPTPTYTSAGRDPARHYVAVYTRPGSR